MPRAAERGVHACAQPRAVVGDAFERIGLIENLQRLLGGRQRHRVRGVGAAVRHAAPDLAHDFLPPGKHGNGDTVAHGLGEGAQIGVDAVEFPAPRRGRREIPS